MWKILICSEDRDFMQDLGHRIRRLAGERLKEIRLFSNKEDLIFIQQEGRRNLILS